MKSSFLILLFQITDSLEIVCIDLAIFQACIRLNVIIKLNYLYGPSSCFKLWNYYIIYDLSMRNWCNTDSDLVVITFRSRNFSLCCRFCFCFFCTAFSCLRRSCCCSCCCGCLCCLAAASCKNSNCCCCC